MLYTLPLAAQLRRQSACPLHANSMLVQQQQHEQFCQYRQS
jgi:hypothetical protein